MPAPLGWSCGRERPKQTGIFCTARLVLLEDWDRVSMLRSETSAGWGTGTTAFLRSSRYCAHVTQIRTRFGSFHCFVCDTGFSKLYFAEESVFHFKLLSVHYLRRRRRSPVTFPERKSRHDRVLDRGGDHAMCVHLHGEV